jgi:hypothetical protein
MGDDQGSPPLTRRVPGATRAAPVPSERAALPEPLLQRMQAVVSAAHARAAEEQRLASEHDARREQAGRGLPELSPSVRRRVRRPANGSRPPAGMAPSASWSAPWSDADAEDDTSPLPRLTATGAVASPVVNGISVEADRAPKPDSIAQSDRALQPDHALRLDRAPKQDRHAAKRERAAAKERERAARQERARQEQQRTAEQERQRAAERKRERAARPEHDRLAAAMRAPTDLLEHPPPRERKPPTTRRRRTTALVASAAVLVAAGSLAIVMSALTSRPAVKAEKPVADARTLAAAWVGKQVSKADTVSCDPVMCRALRARGVRADKVLTPGLTAHDLLRSQVVVATAAIRKELGSGLASDYAPAVLASFGSGNARIDIRVVAPHGAQAYETQLSKDLGQRKAIGSGLVSGTYSTRIVVPSATARRQLATGQVDSRLLYTIENLAGQHPIRILTFGDSGPGASAKIPLRSVELTEAVGATTVSGPADVQALLAILRTQGSPWIPAYARTTRLAGQTVLLIEFAAPGPLLLLSSLS